MSDFQLSGHGNDYLLRPVSQISHAWAAMRVPHDAETIGGAVLVSNQSISDVVDRIIGDGLKVGGLN